MECFSLFWLGLKYHRRNVFDFRFSISDLRFKYICKNVVTYLLELSTPITITDDAVWR